MGNTISNCCQLEEEGISPYQKSYLHPGASRTLSKRSCKGGRKKNVRFVENKKSTSDRRPSRNTSFERGNFTNKADSSSPTKNCVNAGNENVGTSVRNSVSGSDPSFIKHVKDIKSIFRFDRKIGDGKFGTVFLAHPMSDLSANVAVKLIPQESFSHRIEKELLLLKSIQHSNVIRYISAYKDNEFYYIVTEHYEGGELFQKIVSEGQVDEFST